MKNRFYISLSSAAIILASIFLLITNPIHTNAAGVGSDGSTCATTISGVCIGYDGKGHGSTATNPDFNANTVRISGCDLNNTNIPNIGTLAATAAQSNVVPVYDDAVTINTGYLVYKACVLDSVAAGLKQASTAKIAADTIKFISEGDNGNPYFVQNIAQDRAMIVARNTTEFYQPYNTNGISASFKDDVTHASYAQYLAEVNGKTKSYAGDFGDDAKQKSFLNGDFTKGGGLSSLWKMATNPANSPIFAYANLNASRDASNAQVAADRQSQYVAGNGYIGPEKAVTIPTDDPNSPATIYQTKKPGALIAQVLAQAVTSGFRQQESAQTLDQIIDGTFAGLGARVVSDPNGLVGVSSPTPSSGGSGSSQSYLDQMLQTILGLIQKVGTSTTPPPATGSSAFVQLSAALTLEQQYLTYRQQVTAFFGIESAKLSSTQDSCWVTLASEVAKIATSTPYTVATSTTYANAATANIITPISLVISQDIDHSTSTIAVLQSLIASVSTNPSSSADAAALAQLSALTSNQTLHTTAQVTAAQKDVTDISANIGVKVDATIATWKQGTGWCNASSTTVVQSWLNAWKH